MWDRCRYRVSPLVRFWSFLICSIGLSVLKGRVLWVFSGAWFVVALLHQPKVLVASLWRLRWLLTISAVSTLFFVPGQRVLPTWAWSPTVQGVKLFGTQWLHLSVLLAIWAVCLSTMSFSENMEGLCQLLAPLHRLGVPVHRFIVRVGLVLELWAHQDQWAESFARFSQERTFLLVQKEDWVYDCILIFSVACAMGTLVYLT